MKYLLLVFVDELRVHVMSRTELDIHDANCQTSLAALQSSGQVVCAQCLPQSGPATVVQIQDGRVVLGDFPPGGANLHRSGLLLVEASDLNVAIRLASRLPHARMGPIVIRTR